MTDDTIDSEVVDILESLGNKILSHSDKMVWSVNRKREADVNAIEETEQIIKQLIAQEANKARLDEREKLKPYFRVEYKKGWCGWCGNPCGIRAYEDYPSKTNDGGRDGDSDGLREFAGSNVIKSVPQAPSKHRGELSDEFRQLFADAIPSEHAKRKRLKAAVRQWLIDYVPSDDKNVRQFLEEL